MSVLKRGTEPKTCICGKGQANETLQGNGNNTEEGSEILVSMTKCSFYEKCETMSPMVM